MTNYSEAKHLLSRNAKQVADPLACDIMRKVAYMAVACMAQNDVVYRETE